MTSNTPVVYVVDDDISVREALEELVRYHGWTPELYDSAEAFLAREPATVPTCLVLDVNLPDLSGLDLQERVVSVHLSTPIIFVTGYGDIPKTVQAMKAGAAEFLTKPFAKDTLLAAIRQALERSRAAIECQRELFDLRDRYASLSPREREVMGLVVTGLLNKQIGFELEIREITVKVHRGQVMRKMKARSLAELVNMAAKLGLGRRD